MQKTAQIILNNAIYLCLLVAALCLTAPVNAQDSRWYTSDGELSSSLINNVLYDSHGMLWITTEDCLNRFDGSKFTIYRHNPSDPHSIANDHVNNTFEDQDGRLFVCTHAGVQLYDPATDSFSEPLKVKGTGDSSSPISELIQRSTGELWAVGNEVYRIAGEKDEPYLEHLDLPAEMRFIVRGIADGEDNIWLAKHTEGLYRIAPNGKVKHYFGQNDNPVMTSFGLDLNKRLYAGSAKRGLFRYNPETDSFDNIDLGPNSRGLSVMSIKHDENGLMFIGTDGDGMLTYDPETDNMHLFEIPNIDFGKLKIHGVAKDYFGNLWVGVFQKGLLKIPPRSAFFKSIDQRQTNIIGTCCVTALLRDKDGTLWVGTDNDDIYAVDLNTRTSRHYTIDVPATIMGLFEDSKGNIWIGSYNRGMGIIDRNTGKYTPVKIYNKGIEVSHVYDFAELPDGDILIATMGAGLFKYHPEDKTSEKLSYPDLGNWITTVKLSKNTGKVYVGSYDGLFIFNTEMTQHEWALRGHIIHSIHEEPAYDDIWLGTNSGLVQIGTDGTHKRTYNTADGLPSQSVYAIEHGDDGLWISTNHGLSKFEVSKGQFTNFTVDQGLPNNEFSRNSSFKDNDGNIYFGGINGITSFKASDISIEGMKLTPRITDFYLGDVSVNANTRSGSHKVIDCPITEATTFNLGHDDNSFSIRINTKEFANNSQTDFYYSFDGDPWVRILNSDSRLGGTTLTFTNVPSGKHSLKVKVVNAGVESEELNVTINIDTVWYASWWAKLIYALLFLTALYLVYRQMQHRINLKRQEEQRKHKAEILESKLQFFTNISHEIRTPLSLVIGPMQKLQKDDTDPQRQSTYKVVVRNANRILRLVNELMDLRKIDNKQMKLKYTEVNLAHFVGDVYETFTKAAEAKDINFVYNHEGYDDLKVWVDPINFDKVIMNLLSNAIKFTPEQGTVTIDLRTGEDIDSESPLKHYAEISVTDTGIGITEADRQSIFNRFFQGSNNTAGGTGIGLHLTRELVQLHQGTIEAEPNPAGHGTRFTVRIPLGAEHLSEEDKTAAMSPEGRIVNNPERWVEPEQNTPEDKEDKPANRNVRKGDIVYVVEDDEEIREYLVKNLNQYFRTTGFSNGKAALEAIHTNRPALVITDVMMPEMDGYTLTKKIKQNINLNQIPVIILTAKTQEEDNLEAIDSGAAVYISKPFNIDVVIRTAQNLVNSVARLRNAFSGNQSQEDKLEEIEVSSNDDKLMERVMKVINKNLSNSDITVEMIAREIGISRVHLHRKLKELTNQSTRDFIRNIRLQAAAKLLREKKLTVAEVADLVGFKQANNFSTVFKEMFGMSPTAYAAKYHSNQ